MLLLPLVAKVSSVADDPARFEEACHRTLRWLDRCIAANANPDTQNLFGIVQGGLDTTKGGLREVNLAGMVSEEEYKEIIAGFISTSKAKRKIHLLPLHVSFCLYHPTISFFLTSREKIARDLPGYAIGGLAGGEEKQPFWRVVHQV